MTDAKGKLQFHVHVFRGPEDGSIWVEGPADLAEELEARLTRYLIADDVEVENLTDSWKLVHVVDAAGAPEVWSGSFVRKAQRIGAEGYDVLLPADAEFPCDEISDEEAEARRIEAGLPAWGAELVAGMLPPEAGLDQSAISYHKGCYIGQEVLSRMKTAGKVNRRLAKFSVPAGVKAGDELRIAGVEKEAGEITSVSSQADESGDFPALGYVEKVGFEASEFSVEGVAGVVRVA